MCVSNSWGSAQSDQPIEYPGPSLCRRWINAVLFIPWNHQPIGKMPQGSSKRNASRNVQYILPVPAIGDCDFKKKGQVIIWSEETYRLSLQVILQVGQNSHKWPKLLGSVHLHLPHTQVPLPLQTWPFEFMQCFRKDDEHWQRSPSQPLEHLHLPASHSPLPTRAEKEWVRPWVHDSLERGFKVSCAEPYWSQLLKTYYSGTSG